MSMKARMSLLCTVFVTATLVVICGIGCAGANGRGERDAGGGGPNAPTLEGTRWNAVEIGANPAEITQDAGGGPYLMLTPDDEGVSGSTGVNFLSGKYERDGDELKFGPLITTRRAGPPPLMQQEIEFTRALDRTGGWRIREGMLELLDADGNPVARFRPSALGGQ
jgi:heat shock protein HslJ